MKSAVGCMVLSTKTFTNLSLTYNSLQYSKPRYLRDLFIINQPALPNHPPFSLYISTSGHYSSQFSNWAISDTAPRLRNELPPEFRTFSVPPPSSLITYHHLPEAPLSITPKIFHSKLKSFLFKNSYPDPTDHLPSNSLPKRHPP